MAPWRRAGAVFAVVVVADQLSKAMVRSSIDHGDRNSVFPGIDFVNVRNRGVAFGLFGSRGLVVELLTGLALLALMVYFVRHKDRPLAWLATGLLLGGAAGNLIDRVRADAVTDFIDLPFWPSFNVADMAITAGVL